MTKLRISPELALPESTVTSTLLVLGGKGMGKTNLDAVIAEEVVAARMRFSWMDPIGIAWSLQHGATKSEPGLEVLVLGGVHGDIPILPTAGAVVADLVVNHDVSVVIDISRHPTGKMWSHGEQIRFVTEYMTRLYELQGERRRPLLQIFDEIGRFAPQSIPSGAIDIAKCLGAIEQIVELGRNVGIGMLMSTQRNAKIAASIRELADAIFAFRTVGPLSLKAVVDWLGDHVEKRRINPIVEQIRALPVGHAMLISPGWLQLEKVLAVRKRTTFDASATPTGAGSPAPGKARKPDLVKYRELMAATIEKAKADDPRELQRVIATLRKELEAERRKQPAAAPAPKPKTVYALRDGQLARAESLVKRGMDVAAAISDAFDPVVIALSKVSVPNAPPSTSGDLHGRSAGSNDGGAVRAGATAPRPVGGRAPSHDGTTRSGESRPTRTTEGVSGPQQKMLDALAWLDSVGAPGARWSVLAFLSGQSPKSSGFEKNVSTLRTAGLLQGNGKTQPFNLTTAAQPLANWPVAPATSEELHRAIYAKISTPQERMRRALIDSYPRNLTWDELAEKGEQSPNSSGFEKNVSTLKSYGLIEGQRNYGYVALSHLFLEERVA